MEIINIRHFMKMRKYSLFLGGLILTLLSACGLDLQTDYDYKPSVDDPHVNMTVWDYMSTHQADFSTFQQAVEYVGLEDYYQQMKSKYTYLLLNNTAMKAYMDDVFPGTESISDCDSATVRKMILYHIIDGEYSSYGQLDVEPRYVLTMLQGEEGLMTMSVWKNPWQAAVGKVLVNQTGSNANSPQRNAKTSNILATNGVVHIFENYCYYRK